MTTIEEWRSVPGVALLEVSSLGRIRSIPYETAMPNGGIKVNQLQPTYGCTVYPSPNYCRKQIVFRRKTYRIHILVAAAFLGPRPEGLDVSHKDEIGINNQYTNLEYLSRKANLNKPKIKEYHRQICRTKFTRTV